MPASTAPLQSLSSKLVKSRHSLHATNLQCEQGRAEAERSRQEVEANDSLISQLEEQERKLKMQCVCHHFFAQCASIPHLAFGVAKSAVASLASHGR